MKEDCCVLCVSAARQSIAVAISLGVHPERPDSKRLIKSSCVSWSRRMRISEFSRRPAEPPKSVFTQFCFLLTQALHNRERRERNHSLAVSGRSDLVTSARIRAAERTFRDAGFEI